jgi:hypothetical protein
MTRHQAPAKDVCDPTHGTLLDSSTLVRRSGQSGAMATRPGVERESLRLFGRVEVDAFDPFVRCARGDEEPAELPQQSRSLPRESLPALRSPLDQPEVDCAHARSCGAIERDDRAR